MEQTFLISNESDTCVEDFLLSVTKSCDEIYLSIAYFSKKDIIDHWLRKNVKLSCIVALQPPTDPHILRQLLPLPPSQVELKFFDSRFHSKCYIFLKRGIPFGALLGSSNLTNGGLSANIETNVYITDPDQIDELMQQFQRTWGSAAALSPDDIKHYEKIYLASIKDRKKAAAQQNSYERKHVVPRLTSKKRVAIKKTGRDFYGFWKCVDDIIRVLGNEAQKHSGKIPLYFTVDQFWHWIVAVKKLKSNPKMRSDKQHRESYIRKYFKEYVLWEKESGNSNHYRIARSKTFRTKLSKFGIGKLSRRDARDLYSLLHSGGMRTQRFNADISFSQENPIGKIRTSLDYLIHSSDDIAQRISALLNDDKYKLKHFGKSNIQEINGWVFPNKMPIRNDKADKAIKALGYTVQ